MKRTEKMNFRVSAEEKKRIQSRSAKAKMNTSMYCRDLVLSKEIVVIEGLPELVYELNKIGTNVNQIAFVLNSNKQGNIDLKCIRHQLDEVLDKAYTILESGE